MEITAKVQMQHSMITIPKTFLEDDSLTLAEKGLYASFFVLKQPFSFDDSDTQTLAAFEGLKAKGYIIAVKSPKKYKYKVVFKPAKRKVVKKEPKPVVEENTHKFNDVMQVIADYTDDPVLRESLNRYFYERHHKKGRFSTLTLWTDTVTDTRRMLAQLDSLDSDKRKIVKASLDGQYFKFFEQPVTTVSTDGVSNAYTAKEVQQLREQAAQIRQNGGKAY